MCSGNLSTQLLQVVCFKMMWEGWFIAELRRTKRASKAPSSELPSSRENLVMTSAYERASKRPYIRTDSGGGGVRLDITLAVTHTGS